MDVCSAAIFVASVPFHFNHRTATVMLIALFSLLFLAGNTRVVNQKELEFFRDELKDRLANNYNVILKEKKLPMSLLQDHQKVKLVCSI
jgi:c-di-AMP phosphodiesterase-like protein